MVIQKQQLDDLARNSIESKFLDIRFIQKGRISSIDLFKIIANVFRETGGETENVFLIYLIRQLERQERNEAYGERTKKDGHTQAKRSNKRDK